MAKILVATEKPFAAIAVKGIREVVEQAGDELILLGCRKSGGCHYHPQRQGR